MIVDINEDLHIRFDSTCWSIEKRQKIEKGKDAGGVRWPSIGYYGGLDSALHAVLTKHFDIVSQKERMTIEEAVELMKQTKCQLIELAKKKTSEQDPCTIHGSQGTE